MNKKEIQVIIGIIILITIIISLGPKIETTGKSVVRSTVSGTTQPAITKENFPIYLQNQKIITDLPKKAEISLKFYNFDTGQRQWEESYIIKKGTIQKGQAQNPDLTIILHSKYIPQLANFCSAAKQSKSNQDLTFTINIGKVKFLWKYKGMMKYKGCFGF